jgi:excisionase family DNA binding protein
MAELPDPRVKPWMTIDEALPWLPCGRNVAYEAVRSGEIPSLRIGRNIAIPTSWLWSVAGLNPSEGS